MGIREGSCWRVGDGENGFALVFVSVAMTVTSLPLPMVLKRACFITRAARRLGHGATGCRKEPCVRHH